MGRNGGGKDWKPGQSGNPLGAGHPSYDFRRLNKKRVSEAFNKLVELTEDELEVMAKDPKVKMLEKILASVMLKAYKHGDQSRFDFLLTRMIGKPKEEIEVNQPRPTIVKTSEGTFVMGQENEERQDPETPTS